MNPIPCIWTGSVFQPSDPRFVRMAAAEYGQGEVVPLIRQEPRSQRSHDHYFAVVHEAWLNLPEALSQRFPTEDHLRKYALCKAGYCDVETFVASSRAEAIRLSSFVGRGARDGVQIVLNGASITRLTPHSQSFKAMGKRVFQESKDKVLAVLAEMIGVEPETLGRAA